MKAKCVKWTVAPLLLLLVLGLGWAQTEASKVRLSELTEAQRKAKLEQLALDLIKREKLIGFDYKHDSVSMSAEIIPVYEDESIVQVSDFKGINLDRLVHNIWFYVREPGGGLELNGCGLSFDDWGRPVSAVPYTSGNYFGDFYIFQKEFVIPKPRPRQYPKPTEPPLKLDSLSSPADWLDDTP